MSRARTTALTVLAAAVALTPVLSVAAPAHAATPAPQRLISGWMPYWDLTKAKTGVLANGDLVNIASPFWYRATSATTIAKESGAGNAALVDDLRKRGIKVVPTVVDGMTPASLASNLANATWRKNHVNTLVTLAVANRYDGLDLDYENIAFGSTRTQRPALRAGFTALVSDLSKAMHAKGKSVTLAVVPTTGATTSAAAAHVYDYAALGRSADMVRVMAYDYAWAGGTAGPIAPIAWVNRVMTYTISVVPKHKVQTGVPAYSYDWGKPGVRAKARSYTDTVALMKATRATRKWDAAAQSPYFTYKDAAGVAHTVHYTDAAAVLARVNLTKALGANGITLWAFGQEDPAMWAAVRGVSASGAVTKPPTAPAVKVTTRWSATTVRKGARPTLTVTAGKAAAGRTAYREQYINGRWVRIATARLSSQGTHTFKAYMVTKGRKTYRVVLPATAKAKTAVSATSHVTVR
jgi:spore germination protein YaaH